MEVGGSGSRGGGVCGTCEHGDQAALRQMWEYYGVSV